MENEPNEGTEGTEATEVTADETIEEGAPEGPAPRKHKVKVDGQEIEVDEETLLKDYQLSRASYARMQDAARIRQEAEAQVEQIRALAEQTRQDPRTIFKALGLDARAFAEALLTEEIENELLSPEEKELRELRAWRARQESESEAQKKKSEQEAAEALTQQAGVEIESEIVDALKSSGLRATPRTVARVAEMILASLDGEGPRMKAADALQRLQPEYRSDVVEMLEAQDPETIETEYPSLYAKILKHAANKANAPVPSFQKGVGKKKTTSAPRAKTWDELMKD